MTTRMKKFSRHLTNMMYDKNIIDAIYFTSRRTFTVAENLIYEYKLQKFYTICLFLCFDDVSNSRIANMKINYVIQPIKEMAVKSFNLLLNKFKGELSYDHYVFTYQVCLFAILKNII
jgi:DNA-binding LacI/PurR family transcriptional regulator